MAGGKSEVAVDDKPKDYSQDMDASYLRENIEGQVAQAKRAYKHVEKTVLADSIDRNTLEDVVNEIMAEHFSDIVEERFISKLCGYPLCSNKLNKISKQNLRISVQQKMIYDITERKRFCSNLCFKASKFVESQVPTSPLWMRKERIKLNLFDDVKSEETQQPEMDDELNANLQKEQSYSLHDEKEECDESDEEQLSNLDASSLTILDSKQCEREPNNTQIFTILDSNEYEKEPPMLSSDSKLEDNFTAIRLQNHTKLIDVRSEIVNYNEKINIEKLSVLLQEWCTIATYKFLQSGNINKKHNEHSKRIDGSFEDRLPITQTTKTKDEELRAGVESLQGSDKRPLKWKKFFSPLADSRSQESIRRRIVSQKLRHGFSEAFSHLHLSQVDFNLDLTTLINTFRFTNNNISLKPKEWKIIATALLHEVSKHHEVLAVIMKEKSSEIQSLVSSCGIDEHEFTKLLVILRRYDDNREIETKIDETLTDSQLSYEYDNDSLD